MHLILLIEARSFSSLNKFKFYLRHVDRGHVTISCVFCMTEFDANQRLWVGSIVLNRVGYKEFVEMILLPVDFFFFFHLLHTMSFVSG